MDHEFRHLLGSIEVKTGSLCALLVAVPLPASHGRSAALQACSSLTFEEIVPAVWGAASIKGKLRFLSLKVKALTPNDWFVF